MNWMRAVFFILIVSPIAGCSSAYKKIVGADTNQVFSKIYVIDYPVAWEAAMDALKASPMEVVNRENGSIQTKWIDNTAERNMLDSSGGMIPYVKAQYRFGIAISKGFYQGKQSVKVSVQKEQQFQRDVLEGWKNMESDGIQENSLLYRIGKLIEFKARLQEIENEKLKKQLKNTPST